ncbi:MAG: tRNA lysidine(34) synthetase TilS [Gloeomargarita sp. DG02_1_bins_92]
MNLLRQVRSFLRQFDYLPPHSRVLVAVSGGQDSLCLLDILHRLQPRWGWTLGVVHCDHGWRPDSQDNARYLQHLVEQYGYPYYLLQAQNLSPQEAKARQWRYQALVRVATQNHYPIITTGHTASDRVETFLFNLWRGSGLDGLVALSPSRALSPQVRLVRPLWRVPRTATAAYCQQQGLTVWPDATNADMNYRRNRIRRELLPYLRTHFNPQVEQQLLQTLEILSAEQEFWRGWLQAVWPQVYDPEQQTLNRPKLRKLPMALQRYVLRLFLHNVLRRAVNFRQVEQVRRLLTENTGASTAPLPGGWRVVVRGDVLAFNPGQPAASNSRVHPRSAPAPDAPLD